MTSAFFEQEKSCPVCEEKFKTTRVRSSACVVVKRDTDFCISYRDINPLHYSIHVCPHCHYAALDKSFSEPLNPNEKARLQKGLELLKSEEPDLGKERNAKLALRANELAIQSAQIKKAGPGTIGSLFLRAAWFARELKNNEIEQKYIEQARVLYKESYEKERLREGKMSEARMMYIIGELNRRTGNYQEAIRWFSRVVTNKDVKREPEIERLARDQWDMAKEQYKNPPKVENNNESEKEDNNEPKEIDNNETIEQNNKVEVLKERSKGQRSITLYQDQLEWIDGKDDFIIRASLDGLMEIGLDLSKFTNEDDLKNQIKSLFAKTNTGA